MMDVKKNLPGPGTIIGANVKIAGTLQDENEIIMHGKIEGEIISEKNLIITETAYVKGPISAETIQVAGQVHGSITATGKLEIMPTGRIFGSITTKDLTIRSGAVFIGKSVMPGGENALIEESDIKETVSPVSNAKSNAEYEVE